MNPHPYDDSYSTTGDEQGRCVVCHESPHHPWHSPGAQIKHSVRTGEASLIDALEHSWAADVLVRELIAAQPGWTPERARRLLFDLDIYLHKAVRELRWDEVNELKLWFRLKGQAAA